MFLARYIEKYGTGILMMIRESLSHSLPEPGFQQHADEFAATVWRDWLTEEVMTALALTERERAVVALLKAGGQIGNQEYQATYGVSKATASRHLETLAGKGVVRRVGTTGKGTHYVLTGKGLTKGSIGSRPGKGS